MGMIQQESIEIIEQEVIKEVDIKEEISPEETIEIKEE